MTSDEKRAIESLGAAPASGEEAEKALRRALAEKAKNSAPLTPEEAEAAFWAALKAPAVMLRDVLTQEFQRGGEAGREQESRALAAQLRGFDWGKWSASLNDAKEIERRATKPKEIEGLLCQQIEEAFHAWGRERAELENNPNLSDERVAEEQALLRERAAPKIEAAKRFLRGIREQKISHFDSIEPFVRQRALEPFAEQTGWPWSEAQAEALEATGLWRVCQPETAEHEKTARKAWADRVEGLWPTPFEDVNRALLDVMFIELAAKNKPAREWARDAGMLFSRAESKKDFGQALSQISESAARHGVDLSEHPQALWGSALTWSAERGRLDALSWCLARAQDSGLRDEQLQQIARRGADDASEPQSLAFRRFGALCKWLLSTGAGTRADEEFDQGFDLLLRAFPAERRADFSLQAVAARMIEMGASSLIEANEKEKDSPSSLRIRKNTIRVVKKALSDGADPNTENPGEKTTPLMAAAWTMHAELAELLMEAGARAFSPDAEGKTAVDFAFENQGRSDERLRAWREKFKAQAEVWEIRRELSEGKTPPEIETTIPHRAPRRM